MKKSRSANILVTGAHRSGTTWVGRTIAFHDAVTYISEPFNVSHPNRAMDLILNTWFDHAPTSDQHNEIKFEYQDKYPSWFIVKHETLASDPVNEFEKIFRYLDLRMDDKIISLIKEYTSTNSTKTTRATAFGPRDSRQTINSWKYRLTTDEIERVKTATDSIAKQFYTSPAEFEIGPTN